MNWYTDPRVSFRRVKGLIEPTCTQKIKNGTVVFYEVPAKSKDHFTVDVIRYTMQCVYSGEILFPCSFNTDITEKSVKNTRSKVFFDQVFDKTFRRNVTDRLATALMDKCKKPFLFKALGAFSESDRFNCLKVSFMNGETYLIAARDIVKGQVLVSSEKDIKVPILNATFQEQLDAMNRTLAEDIGWFNMALPSREDAMKVRPEGSVYEITHAMDKGLAERIRNYEMEREMGFTDIRERIIDMDSEGAEEENDAETLRLMEEKYNELMEEHFGWELV